MKTNYDSVNFTPNRKELTDIVLAGKKIAVTYYRLSDEEKNGGESSSITNQRKIVEQYCKTNEILIIQEFIDDGYTGSNFDRPGFQNMLKFIKSNTINMVITKDLSRLGRDMSESSYYAERFFPENRIRYIAISDNFDSDDVNLMAPFHFAMNDVYLRDTSRKIKQVLNTKKQNGEYCTCPPFGYMKNPKDKSKLIPDPMTAHIVQKIFSLASDGKSAHAIADILTKDRDITPLKYRVLYRDTFNDVGASRATDDWNHTTVKRILKNEVYLGHTILGKTKKASLKSKKKILMPKEEWIITQNTHPPLIFQEQFDKAQYYIGMNTKSWTNHPQTRKSIFNGLVFCENCGAAMCSGGTVYKGEREKYWYLVCNNISRKDSKRCNHGSRIKYSDLLELIKNELNQFLSLTEEDIQDITESVIKRKNQASVYNDNEACLKNIQNRINEIDKIISRLYRDNVSGLIDDERFVKMIKDFNTESETLKKQKSEIECKKDINQDEISAYSKIFQLAKNYSIIENTNELSEEIVRTFVEKIEIGEKILSEGCQLANEDTTFTQKIKITYRFIGDEEKANIFAKNVEKMAK